MCVWVRYWPARWREHLKDGSTNGNELASRSFFITMEPEPALSFTSSDAYGLLANPYRRRLLLTLLEHNPEDEAAIPDDLTTDDEELEQMLITMTHTHLPKLESYDVIEWDRENNVVRRGPLFDELRPLLELIDNHRDELPDDWV